VIDQFLTTYDSTVEMVYAKCDKYFLIGTSYLIGELSLWRRSAEKAAY